MVWTSSPLFIYGSTLGGSHDPRKTEEVPLPPNPPRFINKHTGHIGGDAVRLNHVSELPPIGRSETLAKQILLPHFCTVGKYLIDCRLCVCVCVCFVCVLECVFFLEGWREVTGHFQLWLHIHELSIMQKKLAWVWQVVASYLQTYYWSSEIQFKGFQIFPCGLWW